VIDGTTNNHENDVFTLRLGVVPEKTRDAETLRE
jgi:hypothetical protein